MKNLFLIFCAFSLVCCTPKAYPEKSSSSSIPSASSSIESKELSYEFIEELKKDPQYGSDLGGEMDYNGKGVFGRRVTKTPALGKLMNPEIKGKVVVKLCIDPQGKVSFVELIPYETTITDEQFIRNALSAAMKYRYEKDFNAPEQQCGKFTFIMDMR